MVCVCVCVCVCSALAFAVVVLFTQKLHGIASQRSQANAVSATTPWGIAAPPLSLPISILSLPSLSLSLSLYHMQILVIFFKCCLLLPCIQFCALRVPACLCLFTFFNFPRSLCCRRWWYHTHAGTHTHTHTGTCHTLHLYTPLCCLHFHYFFYVLFSFFFLLLSFLSNNSHLARSLSLSRCLAKRKLSSIAQAPLSSYSLGSKSQCLCFPPSVCILNYPWANGLCVAPCSYCSCFSYSCCSHFLLLLLLLLNLASWFLRFRWACLVVAFSLSLFLSVLLYFPHMPIGNADVDSFMPQLIRFDKDSSPVCSNSNSSLHSNNNEKSNTCWFAMVQ